jgi:hypothetical protein
VLAALAFLALPGATPAARAEADPAHALDGRSYRIQVGDEAGRRVEDRLSFSGGRMRSAGSERRGFPPAQYTTNAADRGGMKIWSFQARTQRGGEQALFAGEVLVDTGVITGTIRRWKGSAPATVVPFVGKDANPPKPPKPPKPRRGTAATDEKPAKQDKAPQPP